MQTLTIIQPDDMHLHLRDGEALKAVLPFTARQMGRAVIMPNLKPPVASVADAQALVIAALGSGGLLPGEAATIMSMLEARRKGIETVELEARIKSLEENRNDHSIL